MGFLQITSLFRSISSRAGRTQMKAVHEASRHMKEYVQSLHGQQLPGYPAYHSNPTPLLDTGKMKNSVYAIHDGTRWKVSTKDMTKAKWQEYGTTGKNHIPPRPLWSYAEGKHPEIVKPILDKAIAEILLTK